MVDQIRIPEGYTEEHAEYLDTLRESGATNMFGAVPYLVDRFKLPRNVANRYLKFWMNVWRNDNGD